MKKQWCLFCEREFLPRLSPKRPHDPSGEHNSKKMTHHTTEYPKPPRYSRTRKSRNTTPGRTHQGHKQKHPGTDCSKPSCRKQSVCRRQSAANRQPQQPKTLHSIPSDGRRRAHGGPEPASTEHDARASSTQGRRAADAVAPQVVRLPDHGGQFERRLRVQLAEGRGPETGNSETATAAAVEALELARLVALYDK